MINFKNFISLNSVLNNINKNLSFIKQNSNSSNKINSNSNNIKIMAATYLFGSTAAGSEAGKISRKYAEGNQPYTVLIEGNIGSGKTTFLNHFNQYKDICLITEPVDKWRNCENVNLLELMYKEPHRWAMPFQTYVTLTMLESHTLETNKTVKMMERSLYSSRYCFVENMYRNGSIHDGMYHILQEWYKFIEKSIDIRVDLIVYLRTTPEVVYERMKKRARSEESCVPLQYLIELHDLHEEWLSNKKHMSNVPVLILNGDAALDNIASEYKKSEESIFKASAMQPILASPVKRQRFN